MADDTSFWDSMFSNVGETIGGAMGDLIHVGIASLAPATVSAPAMQTAGVVATTRSESPNISNSNYMPLILIGVAVVAVFFLLKK